MPVIERENTGEKDLKWSYRVQTLDFCHDIVDSWEPMSEVWALKHGVKFLGLAPQLTTFAMHNRLMRLYRTGHIPYSNLAFTAVPIAVITYGSAKGFQHWYTHSDIYLGHYKDCGYPCLLAKATAIQAFFGMAFPVITTTLGSFLAMKSEGVRNAPGFSKVTDPKFIAKLFQKTKRVIYGHAGFQFLVLNVYLFFAVRQWDFVNQEMDKVDDFMKSREQKKLKDGTP